MKQNILGQDPYTYEKKLKKTLSLCIAIFAAAVAINILCVACRTADNHYFMLVANILTDIVAGIFLIFSLTQQIVPGRRMYRLLQQPKTEITGQITSVAENTLRYMDMDCYPVIIDDRRLFLPVSPLQLSEGQVYRLYTVSNIIVEVAL